MALAWKKVAQDQQGQRDAVEHERETLRSHVRKNKRALKRVQQYLRKLSLPDMLVECPRLGRSLHSAELDVFANLSHWLAIMHTNISSVFRYPRPELLVDEFHDQRIENDLTPTMSINTRHSCLLPFDVEMTIKVLWRLRDTRAARFSVSAHEEDGRTRRRFGLSAAFPSYVGEIHGFSETRRIVQGNDRLIRHCALATRTSEIDTAAIDMSRSLLFSWTRVRSPRTTRRSPVSQIDVVEVVMPMIPRRIDLQDDETLQQLRHVRDFCVEAMTHLPRVEHQALENLLLDPSP